MSSHTSVLIFAYLFFLCATPLAGQQEMMVRNQAIVQLDKRTAFDSWVANWNGEVGAQRTVVNARSISKSLNIWLLSFREPTAWADVEPLLHRQQNVLLCQPNHYVSYRATPNDPLFGQQWQYHNTGQSGGALGADIDATEAWDISTGGLTTTGDTIVVAVLDDGIDLAHEDIQYNRWVNHAEIPGNGIDDDANGYIDDYRGWNILQDNDDVGEGSHGTSVAGIIGADGNNNIGVAGVNWHVKLMPIKMSLTGITEARVLEAYSYALEHRIRYNQTGGAQGAFIVATNASWGINRGQPANAPIWCSFYDALGEAGILNCAATANSNFNIDETGDLPTACPSDYLLTVTNITANDQLFNLAGYGTTTIDLGAPGQGVYTSKSNNAYGVFNGTSAATPHVTGVAALLYSLDCPALMALVASDPPAATLLIKEAIMAGVDPIPDLQGVSVTGGRLNAFNSMQYLLARCNGCLPASSVQIDHLTDVSATISWVINDSIDHVDFRWREQGQTTWNTVGTATSPLVLGMLTSCRQYEFQLVSFCQGGENVASTLRNFQTDGCCIPPASVQPVDVGVDGVRITWPPVLAASAYQVRYREAGETGWNMVSVGTNEVQFQGLSVCSVYEYQIRTICQNIPSAWSATFTVLTAGCGACIALSYCTPANGILSTTQEYLRKVAIGGFFQNESEGSVAGYQDFTQLSAIEMIAGESYPFQLTPGYRTQDSFPQAWKVWIDFDRNGFFTSSDVVFSGSPTNQIVNGFISVPTQIEAGSVRMRVLMQYNSADSACPFLSGFGEIEDYCIEIAPPVSTTETSSTIDDWVVYPNPASDYVVVRSTDGFLSTQIKLSSFDGRTIRLIAPSATASDLPISIHELPAGIYLLSFFVDGKPAGAKKFIKTQ